MSKQIVLERIKKQEEEEEEAKNQNSNLKNSAVSIPTSAKNLKEKANGNKKKKKKKTKPNAPPLKRKLKSIFQNLNYEVRSRNNAINENMFSTADKKGSTDVERVEDSKSDEKENQKKIVINNIDTINNNNDEENKDDKLSVKEEPGEKEIANQKKNCGIKINIKYAPSESDVPSNNPDPKPIINQKRLYLRSDLPFNLDSNENSYVEEEPKGNENPEMNDAQLNNNSFLRSSTFSRHVKFMQTQNFETHSHNINTNTTTKLNSVNENIEPSRQLSEKNKRRRVKFYRENFLRLSDKIQLAKKNTVNSINTNNIEKSSRETFRSNEKKIKYSKKKLGQKFVEYTEGELNGMDYEEAVVYDTRPFWKFYWSLLKRKQLILFTFFNNSDYNILTIKICLFIFSFTLSFAVNAVFFDDDSMHKLYESNGNYNFLYQIPQIIYSTIVSDVISSVIEFLSLSEDDLIDIKSQEDIKTITIKAKRKYKCIIIKFHIFFILFFLLSFLFWYMISCFCAVYQNTQIPLIKDTIVSFLLSLLYPIAICIPPAIFRIVSLRAEKHDKKCMFKISKILASV